MRNTNTKAKKPHRVNNIDNAANKIGVAGASALGEALKDNSILTTLYLGRDDQKKKAKSNNNMTPTLQQSREQYGG